MASPQHNEASTDPTAPPLPFDASVVDVSTRTVCADTTCIQCGYNLRSLSIEGVCPECGRSVADSTRCGAIGLANPVWRKRVLRGIRMLYLTAFGLAIVQFLMGLLFALIHAQTNTIHVGLLSAFVLAAFILLLGVWFTVSRDATWDKQKQPTWPHTLARVSAVITFALFAWSLIGLCLPTSLSRGHFGPSVGLDVVFVCFFVTSTSTLICLRTIARLAKNGESEPILRYTILAGILLTGVAVLLSSTETLSMRDEQMDALWLTGALLALILTGGFFFGTLICLFSIRKLLRKLDAPTPQAGEPAAPLAKSVPPPGPPPPNPP